MTDDTAFERYHVLLFRRQPVNVPVLGRIGIFETYPVFSVWPIEGISSDARVGHWRHFEGEVLRAHFGGRWPKVLADELTTARQKFLRIDGEDASGQRYRLPRPPAVDEALEERVSTTDEAAAPLARKASRHRPAGRPPGQSVGTLVRHLRECCDIKNYDAILTILDSSGEAWVLSWLKKHADGDRPFRRAKLLKANGNAKRAHEQSCPCCAHGLPRPWKTLVMTYKGQD